MKKNYAGNFISALRSVCGRTKKSENDALSHECTSWIIFSDLTKNNTCLMHKNRDAGPRNQMPLKSREGAPRKWIGLGDKNPGDDEREDVCMGLNASGLLAIVNSGEKAVEHSDPKAKIETPVITRICLAECDTAAQAVEKLEEIRAARQYAHGDKGSIFFFMDLKEAFIVEMTSERCISVRYDHGYAFRANIWHNPDMASVADNTISSWFDSCNREYMVIRGLNRALRSSGRITVPDLLEMSRETVSPDQSPFVRALCYKTTNSASTLELDLTWPDVLSTGYFLIGPPRHTLLVPVPVCVEKYHPVMLDLSWSAAAWKSFEANGYDAEVPAEWIRFEKNMLEEYKAVQQETKQLLEAGKREEAVKFINEKAYAIWQEAADLMALK